MEDRFGRQEIVHHHPVRDGFLLDAAMFIRSLQHRGSYRWEEKRFAAGVVFYK